jgi:hypothetical protein
MRNSETLAQLKHAAKIGLAAVLAFYLARILNLPESYWAAISAIIVMYSDVSKTMMASGQCLVGDGDRCKYGGSFRCLVRPATVDFWRCCHDYGIPLWLIGFRGRCAPYGCGRRDRDARQPSDPALDRGASPLY